MIFTPLLPRPWLVPLGGVGAAHSTWSWQSPYGSFVTMSPDLPTTTSSPFSTFHPASSPLVPCHFDRSFPSNSTTASEGGRPGCCGVLSVPGVTTLGCGRDSSWTAHFFWATAANAAEAAAPAVSVMSTILRARVPDLIRSLLTD